MPPRTDLRLAVTEVIVRQFEADAPSARAYAPATNAAAGPRPPVTGHVIGVSDGDSFGWWGPVTADVAGQVHMLMSRVASRRPTTPTGWSRRLSEATRHSHTGLLAVARGAVELACWDLLGQRHGLPVWRLLRPVPARNRVASYATCFGIRLDSTAAPAVVQEVAEIWPVQKWRPVRRLVRCGHPGLAAVAALPAGRFALDFCGRWEMEAALRYVSQLPIQLAWVEEPCAPGDLLELRTERFPAPVAAGEHCYGVADTAVLSAAGIPVWQPDAVFCGGFDDFRAITEIAARQGRVVLPHGGGLLPALHAAFAGSSIRQIEFHLLLEPRRQVHLQRPTMPEPDGTFAPPQQPGWSGPLHDGLRTAA
jgi:L-alanine-DL-glutamate epimerase-like enolase superfamily enzyme